MSSNRSSSGGVRNLRAMFESGQDSTSSPPPTRGRSPAGSESVASNDSNTPRKLSAVRSNFVAVERSGQVVLERKSSEPESFADKRRKSFSLSNDGPDAKAIAELQETIGSEKEKRSKSTVIRETIPEIAVATPLAEKGPQDMFKPEAEADAKSNGTSKPSSQPAVGGNTNGRKDAPATQSTQSKNVTGHAAKAKGAKSSDKGLKNPMVKSAPQSATAGKPPSVKPEPVPGATGGVNAKSTARDDAGTADGKPKDKTSINKSAASGTRPSTARVVPAPIATSKDAPSQKKSPSKPTSARTARTPKTPTTPKASSPKKAGVLEKVAAKAKEAVGNNATSASSSRPVRRSSAAPSSKPLAPSTNAARVAKPSTQTSPNSKSKPRTVTRAMELPAHLTAPTASSSAKTSTANPQARSRSASRTNTDTAIHRRSSVAKPEKAGNGLTTRKSSIGKPPARHSLPAHNASAPRPSSRDSNGAKATDEGLLARMMRHTASSASKTHERADGPAIPHPKVSEVDKQSRAPAKHQEKSEGSSVPPKQAEQRAEKPKGPGAESSVISKTQLSREEVDVPQEKLQGLKKTDQVKAATSNKATTETHPPFQQRKLSKDGPISGNAAPQNDSIKVSEASPQEQSLEKAKPEESSLATAKPTWAGHAKEANGVNEKAVVDKENKDEASMPSETVSKDAPVSKQPEAPIDKPVDKVVEEDEEPAQADVPSQSVSATGKSQRKAKEEDEKQAADKALTNTAPVESKVSGQVAPGHSDPEAQVNDTATEHTGEKGLGASEKEATAEPVSVPGEAEASESAVD